MVYRTVETGYAFELSRVTHDSIAFLCQGEAEYFFGRDEKSPVMFGSGDILSLPKGTWREGVFRARESKFFSVQFVRPTNCNVINHDIWHHLLHSPAVLKVEHPAYVEGLFRKIHQLKGRQGLGCQVEVEGLLLQIIGAMLQTYERQDVPPHLLHVVQRVETFLLDNFHNPSITVSKLAKQVGWSISYFTASFKRVTGETPLLYLRRVRMNHARDLLAQGDLSISKVARMVGYEDPAYFSRVFQQSIGIPPSRWRVEHVKDRSLRSP